MLLLLEPAPLEEFLIVSFRPGLSDLDRSLEEDPNPLFVEGGETLAPLPGFELEPLEGVISKTEVELAAADPSIPVENLIFDPEVMDGVVAEDVFPPIIFCFDFDLSDPLPTKSGLLELGDPGDPDFLCPPNEDRSKCGSGFRFFEADPPPPDIPPDDPSLRSNFLLSSSDKLLRTSLFQFFEFESSESAKEREIC